MQRMSVPVGKIKIEGNWKKPFNFWSSMENRKLFLNELANKLDISTPSDWGKVTVKRVNKFGGGSLLTHYYKGSLFSCLQSVYKGDSR